MTFRYDRANGNKISMGDLRVNEDGEMMLAPVLYLKSGVNPVTLGGDKAGWVSGDFKSMAGGNGSGSGSGFVAGAPVFTSGALTSWPVSAGGSGYPTNSRLLLSVTGDGTGAVAYVSTNGSGAVTTINVLVAGTGYTTASCSIAAGASSVVIFDLGPDYEQYSYLEVYVANSTTPGGVSGGLCRISGSGSEDGAFTSRFLTAQNSTTGLLQPMYLDGNAAAPWIGMGCTAPGTRYIRVLGYTGMGTQSGTYCVLTARPF